MSRTPQFSVSGEEYIDNLIEENKNLKRKNKLQERALIKLMLKHHYDSIIIDGEEVIDISNYKVVKRQKPKEEKLFYLGVSYTRKS